MTAVDLSTLSRLQRAVVDACEALDGGGAEGVILDKIVRRTGERGMYGAKAHYAKAFWQLLEKGVLRQDKEPYRSWWLTDAAWHALGHEGSVESNVGKLF